jgi:site-specific recombinase XerC
MGTVDEVAVKSRRGGGRIEAPERFRMLMASWELQLRADRKAEATRVSYLGGVRTFAAWLDTLDEPPAGWDEVTRTHCRAFFAQMVVDGKAKDTHRARHCAIDRFFGWLVVEGEMPANPMDGMSMPSPSSEPVPVIEVEVLRRWLKHLSGPAFVDVRDEAIIRLFFDAGLRLAELSNLDVTDIDLLTGTATVLGKGSRTRTVQFGSNTARALDRYLRRRSKHAYGHRPELWVGRTGAISKAAVYAMIVRRSQRAGLPRVHPHQLRHSFAHAWLDAGGSEGDLMALAGWRSPTMLRRYGASLAAERAREAHKRISPGNQI